MKHLAETIFTNSALKYLIYVGIFEEMSKCYRIVWCSFKFSQRMFFCGLNKFINSIHLPMNQISTVFFIARSTFESRDIYLG